jgi:hypothetical protein
MYINLFLFDPLRAFLTNNWYQNLWLASAAVVNMSSLFDSDKRVSFVLEYV